MYMFFMYILFLADKVNPYSIGLSYLMSDNMVDVTSKGG